MPTPNPIIPNPTFASLEPPWQLTALDAWTASVNAAVNTLFSFFGDPKTFTAQYSGLVNVTGSAKYYKLDNFIALFLGPALGVSNDVTFGISNVPPDLLTPTATIVACPSVCFQDNGNNLGAGHNVAMQAGAGQNIAFDIDSNSQGWTPTGQKGIQFGCTLCWMIT